MSDSVWTLWTLAHQDFLSIGFSSRNTDWAAISFSRKKKKKERHFVGDFWKQIWSTSFNFYVLNLIQRGMLMGLALREAASRPAPFPSSYWSSHFSLPISGQIHAALWLNTASFCFHERWRYCKEDTILVYSRSLYSPCSCPHPACSNCLTCSDFRLSSQLLSQGAQTP